MSFRVLLRSDGLLIANLRFDATGTIDAHSAPYDIDVICVSGSGFASVGSDRFPIQAGQSVRWPAHAVHCLWTEGSEMETLIVERYGS